jgi:hypothetical protein
MAKVGHRIDVRERRLSDPDRDESAPRMRREAAVEWRDSSAPSPTQRQREVTRGSNS